MVGILLPYWYLSDSIIVIMKWDGVMKVKRAIEMYYHCYSVIFCLSPFKACSFGSHQVTRPCFLFQPHFVSPHLLHCALAPPVFLRLVKFFLLRWTSTNTMLLYKVAFLSLWLPKAYISVSFSQIFPETLIQIKFPIMWPQRSFFSFSAHITM